MTYDWSLFEEIAEIPGRVACFIIAKGAKLDAKLGPQPVWQGNLYPSMEAANADMTFNNLHGRWHVERTSVRKPKAGKKKDEDFDL